MSDLFPVLTPDEAAELLRCEPGTIEELCRRGELPGHKFGTGWVLPSAALMHRVNQIALEESTKRREARPAAASVVEIRRARNPPHLPSLQ